MALLPQQIAERLLKKTAGVVDSNFPLTVRGISEEAISTYNLVTPNAIWSQADQIPTTPPVLSNSGTSGVVMYYEKLQLVRTDLGTEVSFKSPLGEFQDAIPSKFGFGYNFKIYGAGGATQIFKGDWLVDPEAGVITFYNTGTTEATVNGTNPPYITFYKYIGTKGIPTGGGSGFNIKDPVLLATSTANDTEVPNYNTGISGFIDIGSHVFDGYSGSTLSDGDRIFVKDQSNKIQNGIYVIVTGATVDLNRAPDADGTTPNGVVKVNDYVFVLSGSCTANIASSWVLSTSDAADPQNIQVGTETQNWVVFSRSAAYTAGDGLEQVGQEFQVKLDGTTLEVSSTGLKLSDTVNTSILNKLDLSGGTMTGNIDMGTNYIVVSGTPSSDYHVTNKAYVDAVAQGISPHAPVKVVSIIDITLSGEQTIDNVSLVENDSILVANQSNKIQNGIYVVSGGTWSRRTDADGDPNNEIELGDFVFVESGVTNGSSGWVLGKTNTSNPTIDPDTDEQEWFKMAAPGSYTTDGQGIELSGNIFSIELSGNTLVKSGFGLKLNDTLSNAISTNTVDISTLSGVTDTLSTVLSSEISDRISGDTSLSTSLSSEISDRTVVDESLSTAISIMSGSTLEISTILSDGELLGMIGGNLTGVTNIQSSLSTSLSSEISDRISGDTSILEIINNLSGVTAQTAGSGLTYNAGEQSLNVNVDNWTIKINGANQLVGSQQWIEVSSNVTVSGLTSGNTGLILTHDPITPASAYVNGIEYLVNGATNPATNYPFFYNTYPPEIGTEIWYDPTIAGFDIMSGTDVVMIKYLTTIV